MAETENAGHAPPDGAASQPGQVIAPDGSAEPSTSETPQTSAPAEPPATAKDIPAAEPNPDPQTAVNTPPASELEAKPAAADYPKQPVPGGDGVSWSASEYIAHEKSVGWYLSLAGCTVLLVAVIYLLTRDYITSGVILFCAVILGIAAGRQPRELDYRVDNTGIQIGAKHYPFDQFRSFAVVPEGAFSSVVFMPLKRFAPLLTVYYAPEHEEAIVSILTNWLPLEEAHNDPVDSLMRRIRF